jgi:hypothetical protein
MKYIIIGTRMFEGEKMNVSIRIDYKSDSKISQSASLVLKGRRAEQVALQWWKELKREMSYRAELEVVTADGKDITQLVKDLEEQEWEKALNDTLPF